ncbi:MAG: hypothetical protein ACKVZ0_15630 [Gemmatimonadales bacterium]
MPATTRSWLGATVVASGLAGETEIAAASSERYLLSFWAAIGQETVVRVSYAPRTGQTTGDQFLEFQIPSHGLLPDRAGARFGPGEPIRITVRIEAAAFQVDFDPAGVRFNRSDPVTLRVWLDPADSELAADAQPQANARLRGQQLDFWYAPGHASPWRRLAADRDSQGIWVQASLCHSAGHAISW